MKIAKYIGYQLLVFVSGMIVAQALSSLSGITDLPEYKWWELPLQVALAVMFSWFSYSELKGD